MKLRIFNTIQEVLAYFRSGRNTPLIIISVAIGLLGGFGAIAFRLLIDGLQYISIQKTGTTILERLAELPYYHLLLLPAVGLSLVSTLVYYFAREAKGHGVPEVMEAVALHEGHIRLRVVFIKSLASAMTIATGGSIGREGPIVQIGSAIGSSVGQWLRLPAERLRVLVGCGAAAGIAATFNAPVAGVIFAIEIIMGNYAITTLTPLILSSVIATVTCHAFPEITGGNVRAFFIPFKYTLESAWEIPAFFLLGGLAALVSLLFIVGLYKAEDLFDRIKIHPGIKGFVGGLMLGGIYLLMPYAVGYPHCFGIGYQGIEMALRGELTWYILVLLVAFKLVAASLTLGAGGSGGIFAPSLFLGAMMGGAFGKALELVFPTDIALHSGAYALVGMGAVVAGTTHAPITAILIIFELTGNYQIMLPLMIACVIASLAANRFKRDSIYTLKLSRRGVTVDMNLEAAIMESTKVKDLMISDIPTIHLKASFQEILSQILEDDIQEIYVVDDDRCLKGIITLNDVKAVINESGLEQVLIAADLMGTKFQSVTPENTLVACMNKFGASSFGELPVVENNSSYKLKGIIAQRSIFLLYNREVLRKGTLGLKYVSGKSKEERKDYIEIAEDHIVDIVPVARKMVNRTLKELNIRSQFHINVVSIKAHRYEHREPDSEVPDPDQKLKRTDSLVVVGPRVAIENMKQYFSS